MTAEHTFHHRRSTGTRKHFVFGLSCHHASTSILRAHIDYEKVSRSVYTSCKLRQAQQHAPMRMLTHTHRHTLTDTHSQTHTHRHTLTDTHSQGCTLTTLRQTLCPPLCLSVHLSVCLCLSLSVYLFLPPPPSVF